MYPALSSSRWLGAPASAGSSRSVGMCMVDQRTFNSALSRLGPSCLGRILSPAQRERRQSQLWPHRSSRFTVQLRGAIVRFKTTDAGHIDYRAPSYRRRNRYAEMVRWMAWPRTSNSKSSAQPGTKPHDGVQATVTPAPDADSPPGSGQNAGVAGTTHAVADNQGTDARFPRHDRTASRRLGPIRYAHSGMDDPPGHAPAADDDATGGLVYEAPRPNPPDAPEPAEAPDEGISIFGNIATTEVPEEEEPTLGRNRPITPAPQPVGSAAESKPRPFKMRIGDLRTAPSDRDGQPRVAIRDLPPDVQLRFWRTRLIIMIVVGLLFGVLTKSWVIGLTLAILAGIADPLYRPRTAADHVNGASQSGAQRRTRSQLRKMRRAGYFALDARPIPNTREYIDHLVVGPSGVYAIDSEKWNSKVPVLAANGMILSRGPESQKER